MDLCGQQNRLESTRKETGYLVRSTKQRWSTLWVAGAMNLLEIGTETLRLLGGGFLIDPEHGSDNAQSLQEIVSYSFSEQTWANQSIPNKYYLFGEGQFIEHYGHECVVLIFGGQWSASTSEKKSSLQSLDTILIYDIQSKKFYEQEASNPPATRAQFCSVGAGTADNSSYEIFIYGGQFGGGGDIPQFNDKEDLKSVHILTIPAFTWIKANTEAVSRAFHTCKKAGK
ncbi:hypothetical protein HYALB_00003628 [Hymenoscyphus albidus]|uniref:Uncharacterized protein n=1 Tax=Hymenoscyphus albidus TaxID=595503 RepID=A0A9N9M1B0_9HELO|nr:hypothetical protein HYALB_00003628 [Hymenoscyphus albidus]